jgi:putative membrane protein
MADSEQRTGTGRFEVKGDVPTHFAWLRTRMSMERTLMSWVRTATALIGFGLRFFSFCKGSTRHRGLRRPPIPGRPGF